MWKHTTSTTSAYPPTTSAYPPTTIGVGSQSQSQSYPQSGGVVYLSQYSAIVNGSNGEVIKEEDVHEGVISMQLIEDRDETSLDGESWTSGASARKSSQLPSRAHSRSPVGPSNLADNPEARRADSSWRCVASAHLDLATTSHTLQPLPALAPIPLKNPALSGNPHNNQHRSAGQYKGPTNQSRRNLAASTSHDSLRSCLSASDHHRQHSVPQRRPSSTNLSAAASSSSYCPPPARDQVSSVTRPGGIEKKASRSRLRRRPSAQLLSSTKRLDSLRLDDTMAATSSQHLHPHPLPHAAMGGLEDINPLDKYSLSAASYSIVSMPLSPPPSADYQTIFHPRNNSSFQGGQISLGRPQSMSALNLGAFQADSEAYGVRRSSDPYQTMESVTESSIIMRPPEPNGWTSTNWLNDFSGSLDMNLIESSPSQSPNAQQWVGESRDFLEVEGSEDPLQLRLANEAEVAIMMNNEASFRLESPPAGRGMQRMASSFNFRNGQGYMQPPPSPPAGPFAMRLVISTSTTSRPAPWSDSSRSAVPGPAEPTTRPARS